MRLLQIFKNKQIKRLNFLFNMKNLSAGLATAQKR